MANTTAIERDLSHNDFDMTIPPNGSKDTGRNYTQIVFNSIVKSDPTKWQNLFKKLISTMGVAAYLKYMKHSKVFSSHFFKIVILLKLVYPLSLKFNGGKQGLVGKLNLKPLLKNGKSKYLVWNILLFYILNPLSENFDNQSNYGSHVRLMNKFFSYIFGDAMYNIFESKFSTKILSNLQKNTLNFFSEDKVATVYFKQLALSGMLMWQTSILRKNVICNYDNKSYGFYFKQLTNTKRSLLSDFVILYGTTKIYYKCKEHKLWTKLWRNRNKFGTKRVSTSSAETADQKMDLTLSTSETPRIESSAMYDKSSLVDSILQTDSIVSLQRKTRIVKITPDIELLIKSLQWCLFKYGFNKITSLSNLKTYQKAWLCTLLFNSINQIKTLDISKSFLKSVLKDFINVVTCEYLPLNTVKSFKTLKYLLIIVTNYFI